jgi:hypothetical protein
VPSMSSNRARAVNGMRAPPVSTQWPRPPVRGNGRNHFVPTRYKTLGALRQGVRPSGRGVRRATTRRPRTAAART